MRRERDVIIALSAAVLVATPWRVAIIGCARLNEVEFERRMGTLFAY